ncbi:MAG: hypothetical protein E6I72_09205 [Chloroflexi bacterium]|nr:MAG: hypothetical protein E6I72_09205 [Chloroflexota bacterium]
MVRTWFLGFAVGSRDEAREGLEQQRESQRGQNVGLAEPERGQAQEVPQPAEREPERGHDEDRHVRAPAVGQEGVAELGHDEDQQDGDDQAGGYEVHLTSPTPAPPALPLRPCPPRPPGPPPPNWGGKGTPPPMGGLRGPV